MDRLVLETFPQNLPLLLWPFLIELAKSIFHEVKCNCPSSGMDLSACLQALL